MKNLQIKSKQQISKNIIVLYQNLIVLDMNIVVKIILFIQLKIFANTETLISHIFNYTVTKSRISNMLVSSVIKNCMILIIHQMMKYHHSKNNSNHSIKRIVKHIHPIGG